MGKGKRVIIAIYMLCLLALTGIGEGCLGVGEQPRESLGKLQPPREFVEEPPSEPPESLRGQVIPHERPPKQKISQREEGQEHRTPEEVKPILPIKTTPYNDSKLTYDIFVEKGKELNLKRLEGLVFGDKYGEIEGILTFRGGINRDGPSFGGCDIEEGKLEMVWEFITSTSSWGGGAGWTGQPAIVRWDEETRGIMNIDQKFKEKEGFAEVIYASLGGNIYFFDLESGEESRPPIKVGNPIKGSLSIDPRGYPLLYVGEGIPERGNIGYNIYSLIDGSKLYFINGRDSYAQRSWGAFDSSGIIHGERDTLIVPGENGILYIAHLNTDYNPEEGTVSIAPELLRYRYRVMGQQRLGIENSAAAYRNLLYFADNSGWIQCFDLTTLTPVWLADGHDDTDASLTLEIVEDIPYIYTANEVDHQPKGGYSYIKKINGLTGEILWEKPYQCFSTKGEKPIDGGAFATNVVGKNNMGQLVIFTLARYGKFNGGIILALDKENGEEVWTKELDNYAWSSPTDFYDSRGNGYIIQCNSLGDVLLLKGDTGEELDRINLGSNIESSPAIFEDYMVVGTRGQRIFGVRIK